MKILNVFFVIIFVISAGLQYNDPDPYIWIPIYLYAAVLCWLAVRGKYHPKAYLLGIVVYLAYAAYLFFDKNGVLSWAEEHHAESLVTTMKASKPWIEETREFGGLLILTIAMLINWIYSRNRK
ncbi:transmembrane 220 family protein [Pollutibacter soli]|uniref:transmembrane 220 family protein n=1 Tax=Pollutibacter soli TaxID=3034157 RepID=UPI0030141C17